jgi:hypothetical protein
MLEMRRRYVQTHHKTRLTVWLKMSECASRDGKVQWKYRSTSQQLLYSIKIILESIN